MKLIWWYPVWQGIRIADCPAIYSVLVGWVEVRIWKKCFWRLFHKWEYHPEGPSTWDFEGKFFVGPEQIYVCTKCNRTKHSGLWISRIKEPGRAKLV